jgi:hypothetical protein
VRARGIRGVDGRHGNCSPAHKRFGEASQGFHIQGSRVIGSNDFGWRMLCKSLSGRVKVHALALSMKISRSWSALGDAGRTDSGRLAPYCVTQFVAAGRRVAFCVAKGRAFSLLACQRTARLYRLYQRQQYGNR